MVVVAMPKFGVFTSGDVEAVAGTVLRAVDLPPLVAVTRKCWARMKLKYRISPTQLWCIACGGVPLLFDNIDNFNKLEDFDDLFEKDKGME